MPEWIKQITAALIVLLVTACDTEASKADIEQYNALIAEKHDLLGRAIILQGRLIESFNMNDEVIDDVKFMDAEGYLEELLERIGTVETIEAMPLPSQASDLQELHRQLADAVHFLRACYDALEDSAFGNISYAETAWFKSRNAFGHFTKELVFRTTGEELPDIQERDISEYNIGESMKVEQGPQAP